MASPRAEVGSGVQSAAGGESADAFAAKFPFHLITLGVLLYGTGPVLARASDTTGALLSLWRLWFGVAVFALALIVHRAMGKELGHRRGYKLAVLAGSSFAVNQVAFFTAIKRTSVVDASLIGTMAPVVVALLAIPIFGERPARQFRWWSLVSVFGAVIVVVGASSGVDGDPVGMLLALVSTVAFAVFFLFSKMSRSEIPVLPFLTVALLSATLWVTAYVFVVGLDPAQVGAADRIRALVMAVVPGGLGHIVMTWPLAYVPANVPPMFRLASPAIAGLMAWIFLGEGFTWWHLVGGSVVVLGLAGALGSQAGRDLVAQARAQR